MKILYISSGLGEDYQRDVLFHGLRELLGNEAVDVARINSLYVQSPEAKHAMYGRGYTVYSNLPEADVSRTEVSTKICGKYFDVVVYGSIHRCSEYLHEVIASYPPSRVIFIDGEDGIRVRWQLLGKGVYFKRELTRPLQPYLHPIHFAVPTEKFLQEDQFAEVLQNKKRVFAPCDPRDRSTYVFNTESAYYRQYEESYFGITMKKAGWDCMRHHEIVARGTAPYFLGLEDCPPWTMHKLPRRLLVQLRTLADQDGDMVSVASRGQYAELMHELFAYYKRNFTTTALAAYVLNAAENSAAMEKSRKSPLRLLATRVLNGFQPKEPPFHGARSGPN